MSAPEDLHDLYISELQDLWSANDQMARIIHKMAKKATDEQLREMLERSEERIAEHTNTIKKMLEESGEAVKKEHCKGMEGLVEEAKKHTGEEAPEAGPVLDAVIIAQYQRMSHYGIAGFGTAAAFAETLGLDEDADELDRITKDIYNGDEYLTRLAEMSVNAEAE